MSSINMTLNVVGPPPGRLHETPDADVYLYFYPRRPSEGRCSPSWPYSMTRSPLWTPSIMTVSPRPLALPFHWQFVPSASGGLSAIRLFC